MLNLSFFIAAFTSLTWLFYSFRYLNLSSITSEILFQNITITLFPIAIIWGIFAIIKNHYTEKRDELFLYNLMDQMKKNTQITANLCQKLINTEEQNKKIYALQKFNLFISDINEILSEIIKRSNSVSSAQLEHLWTRTAGGEHWIMAKTFIEIANYQSGFLEHLQQKTEKDTLLKGSILEFNARYKSISELVQDTETENTFRNMVEYGALGKVSETLVPLANKLLQKTPDTQQTKTSLPLANDFALTEEPLVFPSFLSANDKEPQTEITQEKTPVLDKKTPTEIDAGLKAIRQELITPNRETPSAPVISGFNQTQSALRAIKNQSKSDSHRTSENERKTPVISLEELEKEINSSPENNYEDLAYPFGAWLNGEKN